MAGIRASRWWIGTALLLLGACTATTRPGTVGVRRQQRLTIPADVVDKLAVASFARQNEKAQAQGRLISHGAELERMARIAARLEAQVGVFRDDSVGWKWELALIEVDVINASCAPGGKITIYTGLVRRLRLSDDEIAMVIGHEIAHALREHGRERLSLVRTLAQLSAPPPVEQEVLLPAKVSEYESEADAIGMELAARAGYDPRAAISVWEKIEAADAGRRRAGLLVSHPSHQRRIVDLKALLAKVGPLYDSAHLNSGKSADVLAPGIWPTR